MSPDRANSRYQGPRNRFDLLRVEAGWKISSGAKPCTIGIVETGFDHFHPALVKNLRPGFAVNGTHHLPAYTIVAHGTEVVSVICARRVEEGGLVGLAPDHAVLTASQGMPRHEILLFQQDFARKNPGATPADLQAAMAENAEILKGYAARRVRYVAHGVADSIRYLVDRGAKVINISEFLPKSQLAAYPDAWRDLESAVAHAVREDVLIVIGSGNSGTRIADYPGTKDTVLVVGASTLADKRWTRKIEAYGRTIETGSCTGPRLSVVAPCENVVVALPHERAFYEFEHSPMGPLKIPFKGHYDVRPWGATSIATPMVTSLAAHVRSLRPDLPIGTVIDLIQCGAVDLGDPGFDETHGHGRIDFRKTLELARDEPAPPKKG